eukprot:582434-Rhodomonas_salina.2
MQCGDRQRKSERRGRGAYPELHVEQLELGLELVDGDARGQHGMNGAAGSLILAGRVQLLLQAVVASERTEPTRGSHARPVLLHPSNTVAVSEAPTAKVAARAVAI